MNKSKLYLYKRSNEFWYIGSIENGRRVWKSSGTKIKGEALKVICNFEQSPKQEIHLLTLSEFETQFCSLQVSNLRESTINRIYKPAFKSFRQVCGDKLLSSYTPRDIELFKRTRLETLSKRTSLKKTCSPTTVNIEFRTLRSAFNTAINWELIAENVFEKSSTIKIGEQKPTFLSKDDFQTLLNGVKEIELKEVFIFAVLTGIRLGEILNLQWGSVDLQQKLILIKNTEAFSTKTGKNRNVPMNQIVYNLLMQKNKIRGVCAFVFNRHGFKLQHSYVSHKFKKYIRSLGIDENIHFHSLRHTFATWLVQGGVNIYEVQKLLGHSSVKVTEVYSHLAASELHSSVNKINLHELE